MEAKQLAVLAALLVAGVRGDDACPDVCECTKRGTQRVNCAWRGLLKLPNLTFGDDLVATVNLQANKLTTLKSQVFFQLGYSHVQELDISRNRISIIAEDAFFGLTKLIKLFLNDNYLHTVHKQVFGPLSSMTYLNLGDNPLTAITGESSSAPPLLILYLDGCNIRRLEDIFRPPSHNDRSWLETLTFISMMTNNITCLSNSTLPLIKRHYSFYLSGNPFRCNCIPIGYKVILNHDVWCTNATLGDEGTTPLPQARNMLSFSSVTGVMKYSAGSLPSEVEVKIPTEASTPTAFAEPVLHAEESTDRSSSSSAEPNQRVDDA